MNVSLNVLRAACVAAAAVVLAACGGGQQVEPFAPPRVLAFGDEASVIDGVGRKYTVNAVVAGGTALECKTNPNWVQYLASAYGLVFPECNPDAVPAPSSRILAVPGAKVADLQVQIDAFVAGGGSFSAKDLVTIWAGQGDIKALYDSYPGVGEADLVAAAEQAGRVVAGQVNRIAEAGGKVLIATVPDVGLTPFATAEKAAHSDIDRAALLSRLSQRLNAKLLIGLIDDGHKIGLLQADSLVQAVVKSPLPNGFFNATESVCTVALPDCTTLTLREGTSGDSYLWADALQFSAGGHKSLGNLASTRAHNNPF